MARNVRLQILRGVKANIPALAIGEFYLTTDTNELYVGATPGNIPVGVPVFNAAGARQSKPHVVIDKVTLSGVGAATVTLLDGAAFTSATSYVCVAADITAKNRMPQVIQISGSQFTLTGNGGDTVQFICVGN